MINKNINYKTILTAGVLILLSVWIAYNAITEYKNETQNLNMTENKSQTITMDQRAMHPDEMKIIDSIVAKFPELKDFPSNTLPPKSIWIEKVDKGTAVAFVVEGSGVNFVGARCFDVGNERSLSETGTYDPRRDGHNNLPYFSPRLCKPVDTELKLKVYTSSASTHNPLDGYYLSVGSVDNTIVGEVKNHIVAVEVLEQDKVNLKFIHTLSLGGQGSRQEVKFWGKGLLKENRIVEVTVEDTPPGTENTRQPHALGWKPCTTMKVIFLKDGELQVHIDDEKSCEVNYKDFVGNYSTHGN